VAEDTSILVVDDKEADRRLLSDVFTASGYRVFTAANGADARRLVTREPVDIVFLDLLLPGENGVTLLPLLLSIKPALKIIVVTAYPEFQSTVEAREKGAYDYFVKPLDLNELCRAVERISEGLRSRKTYEEAEKYDFRATKVDPEAARIIPERMAKAFSLLPVSLVDGKLKVVMADPSDVVAIDTVKAYTGSEVEPVMGCKEDVVESIAIARYYGEGADLEKSIREGISEPGEPEEAEPEAGQITVHPDDAPVVRLVNLVLLQSVEQRATDIHIEPGEKVVSVRILEALNRFQKDSTSLGEAAC